MVEPISRKLLEFRSRFDDHGFAVLIAQVDVIGSKQQGCGKISAHSMLPDDLTTLGIQAAGNSLVRTTVDKAFV